MSMFGPTHIFTQIYAPAGLRRFVYFVRRSAGHRAELMHATTGITLIITSINLEIRQQQSRTGDIKSVTQDLNSAFSPHQSVLNFWSTATPLLRRISKSHLRRSTLSRTVCESSFWASEEAFETSDNRRHHGGGVG